MADQRIRDLALIFAGGGAGAVVRVLLDFPEFGPWMPANFLACFLMGLSSAILMEGWMSPAASSWWRPLVHTGFWAASPPFRFCPSPQFFNSPGRSSSKASGSFFFSQPFSLPPLRAT